jgi:hypothetical protein
MIMLDTLRRIIGGEVRPVDLWLTIIEILVLALIALEVGWAMKDRLVAWRKWKSYRREIEGRLNALNAHEASTLVWYVVHHVNTATGSDQYKLQAAGFLEPDRVGWRVCEEHGAFLKEWAKKQPPPPPIPGL